MMLQGRRQISHIIIIAPRRRSEASSRGLLSSVSKSSASHAEPADRRFASGNQLPSWLRAEFTGPGFQPIRRIDSRIDADRRDVVYSSAKFHFARNFLAIV
jgi:hypothetical protein